MIKKSTLFILLGAIALGAAVYYFDWKRGQKDAEKSVADTSKQAFAPRLLFPNSGQTLIWGRDAFAFSWGGQPFAVGTPDEVMAALTPYRDRQLTHLSLNLHQPGQDSASVRRSMRLFARELMPALKAW